MKAASAAAASVAVAVFFITRQRPHVEFDYNDAAPLFKAEFRFTMLSIPHLAHHSFRQTPRAQQQVGQHTCALTISPASRCLCARYRMQLTPTPSAARLRYWLVYKKRSPDLPPLLLALFPTAEYRFPPNSRFPPQHLSQKENVLISGTDQ